MKILVSGDKHLGVQSDGVSRLPEQRRVLAQLIEMVRDINPDAYVDLGDLFHSVRPGPEEYEVALEYAYALTKWGTATGKPAYFLLGNHEKPTRGEVTAHHPFRPLAAAMTHFPRSIYRPVVVEPGLLMLPHVTEDEARKAGVESAQAYLDAESVRLLGNGERKVLAFAHLQVPGAVTHEWDRTQRDTGLAVPAGVLGSSRVTRVYAGHIHRYQELERATVVGSSIYVDFSECRDAKGAVLVEM